MPDDFDGRGVPWRVGWFSPHQRSLMKDSMGARLHICMTCKAGLVEDGPCMGARLYNAISALETPVNVTIVPVECLSACNTGAAVAA